MINFRFEFIICILMTTGVNPRVVSIHRGGGGGGVRYCSMNGPSPQMNRNHSRIYAHANDQVRYTFKHNEVWYPVLVYSSSFLNLKQFLRFAAIYVLQLGPSRWTCWNPSSPSPRSPSSSWNVSQRCRLSSVSQVTNKKCTMHDVTTHLLTCSGQVDIGIGWVAIKSIA